MKLHGVVYYRSISETWTDAWSRKDYIARNLIAALKGRDFKGYSTVKTDGTEYRIDNTPQGKTNALIVAGKVLAQLLRAAGYERASVVPIPSSTHIDPTQAFVGRSIADAIQEIEPQFISCPVLYFDECQQKSAEGGTRNPHVIKSHLRITSVPPAPIVLLDDVCTSQGHLKAAAWFLADRGQTVEDAFVVGRTAWERPENMLRVIPETITTTSLFGN